MHCGPRTSLFVGDESRPLGRGSMAGLHGAGSHEEIAGGRVQPCVAVAGLHDDFGRILCGPGSGIPGIRVLPLQHHLAAASARHLVHLATDAICWRQLRRVQLPRRGHVRPRCPGCRPAGDPMEAGPPGVARDRTSCRSMRDLLCVRPFQSHRIRWTRTDSVRGTGNLRKGGVDVPLHWQIHLAGRIRSGGTAVGAFGSTVASAIASTCVDRDFAFSGHRSRQGVGVLPRPMGTALGQPADLRVLDRCSQAVQTHCSRASLGRWGAVCSHRSPRLQRTDEYQRRVFCPRRFRQVEDGGKRAAGRHPNRQLQNGHALCLQH